MQSINSGETQAQKTNDSKNAIQKAKVFTTAKDTD
jgi:hypothetical protein